MAEEDRGMEGGRCARRGKRGVVNEEMRVNWRRVEAGVQEGRRRRGSG